MTGLYLALAASLGATFGAFGLAAWRARRSPLRHAADLRILDRAGIVLYRFSSRRGGIDYQGDVRTLVGLTCAELIARPNYWAEAIHADDVPRIAAVLAKPASDDLFSIEYRLRHANGSWRWILDRAVSIERSGSELLIEGVATDITVRKEAELALAQREQDWDALIELLPVIVFVKEAETFRYVRVNRAHNAMTGLDTADVAGRTDADFWPEQAEFFRTKDAEVMAADGVIDIPEEPIDTPHGRRWLHTRKVRVNDLQGHARFLLGAAEDITERKVMQEAMDQDRIFLRALLDTMPDMVFVKDTEGRYRLANQAFASYFDMSPEAIVGRSDRDLLSVDLVDRVEDEDRRVITEKRTLSLNVERPDASGRLVWFNVIKVPLVDTAGQVTGLLGVGHNISEQRRAESERHQLLEELAGARIAQAQVEKLLAEDRARQVVLAVSEAIVGIDPQGTITLFNPAAERMFGYPECDALGRNLHDLVHHSYPDGRPFLRRDCVAMAAAAGRQALTDAVEVYWRRDGTQFTAAYSFIALNAKNVAAGAVMVIRDVTEREASEARLRMLSRAVEESPALVTLTDTNGVIVYANQRYSETTGYSAEELIGKTHHLVASGRTPARVYKELWDTIKAGETWRGELQNRRRDGSLFWNSLTITPFKDADERVTHFLALGEDITARRELEYLELDARRAAEDALAQLARQEETLRVTTDNLPALICNFDTGQRLNYCNQPYADLFGFDRDAAIGRKLTELIPESVYSIEPYRLRALGGESLNYQAERFGRVFEVTMTPAHGPDGEITGVYALMFDVTEQRQAAAALEQALAAAEAANTAKSEFLANMSHEIRTPMNAIIGLTTLALRTQSPVQQRDYIGKLQRSARDLLGLLNDILDFSKSEAGRLVIDPHPFVLNEVLGTLTDMFADAAKEKGLTFAIKVAPEVPQQLVGDAMRFKQVIANLCSNAIKFTAAGGVQVAVAASQPSDKRLLLKLTVTDTGVGMTAQQTQRIFDAFTQADGSTTRRFGGTGLGLTICRRLLDLMDGEISVESTPGQGSKFVVTLPLALAPAVNASHVRDAAGTSAGLRGARILVVDDYPLNQEIVQAYLTQAGCQVELASDGAEALLRLSQRDYGAVLMDCQMPVMDGYEATRQIRRNLRWKKLPVIAMTANVMQGDREKCLAAGMSDFLPKPVELEDLLATLANWLERTRVSSAPLAAPVPVSVSVPAAESAPAVVPAAAASVASADFSALVNIDLEVALHATMGKPDFLRRILSVFFTSQSTFAARFAEARKSGDAEGATRLAHTLKGAAASIGAAAVRDAALTLERTCKQNFADPEIDAQCAALVAALDPVLAGIGCCLGLEPPAHG